MTAATRRIPVDLPELALALGAEAEDVAWFLDLDTGDVLLVNREWDPTEHGGLTVDEVEADGRRFLKVPAVTAEVPLSDMAAYAAQVSDVRLRESLEIALSAPRPERRFRAVLGWLPEEQERWHRFRQERCEARAHEWLKAHGVVAIARAASVSSEF